jgi:hypothetical protein
VLIFDLAGKKIGQLKAKPPDSLGGPSSIAISKGKMYVLGTFSERVRLIDLPAK